MCADLVESKTNKKEGKFKWIVYFLLAAFVVVILWIAIGLNGYFITENGSISNDQFGAVSALFSGLAFAGLIVTMIMQKKELEFQREELELTHREIIGQREQLENQYNVMKQDSYDQELSNIIELKNRYLESISFIENADARNEKKWSGTEAQKRIIRIITNYLLRNLEMDHSRLVAWISSFYIDQHIDLLYYTRITAITINKGADSSRYTDLVGSIISNYDLIMLYYYSIFAAAEDRYKMMVIEANIRSQVISLNLLQNNITSLL